MNHRVKAQQEGSAFLILLVTLSFLSILITSLHTLASSVAKSRYTQMHAEIAKLEASNNALSDFMGLDTLDPKARLSCSSRDGLVGRSNISRVLCATYYLDGFSLDKEFLLAGEDLPEKDFFPLFDYNRIFSTLTACQTKEVSNSGRSDLGLTLSSESVRSKVTCKSVPSASSFSFSVAANIELDEDFNIPTASNDYYILSSIGYLDAFNTLIITDDTLILSGGDLRIRRLQIPLGKSPKITIASSTGRVYLDEVLGQSHLRVISWLTPSLPVGILITGNTVIPPLLSKEAVAFDPIRPLD